MAKEFLLALDAGHGIHTAGKRCLKTLDPNGTREWVLNDRVSRYIAERAARYKDFRTLRVDDPTGETDVPHAERCRRANRAGADVYLSSHHNAGISGGSGGGLTAFCMKGAVEAKNIRDGLYGALIAAGALKGNRTDPCQEKDFNVLVWSDMPAVLVEYGFMDSAADVPVILTEAYARLCGYAVADWLAEYWGLVPKETPSLTRPDSLRFADVPEDAWYAGAVEYCVARGLMMGCGDGSFAPDRPVTRAELSAVVMRLVK